MSFLLPHAFFLPGHWSFQAVQPTFQAVWPALKSAVCKSTEPNEVPLSYPGVNRAAPQCEAAYPARTRQRLEGVCFSPLYGGALRRRND